MFADNVWRALVPVSEITSRYECKRDQDSLSISIFFIGLFANWNIGWKLISLSSLSVGSLSSFASVRGNFIIFYSRNLNEIPRQKFVSNYLDRTPTGPSAASELLYYQSTDNGVQRGRCLVRV